MKTSQISILIIAVVLLVGLFLVLRPKPTMVVPATTTAPVESQPENSSSSASESAEEGNFKTFELVVRNRKLVSGPQTIQVTEGDNVDIRITVDEVEELHLHGYDKAVELEKDKPADLKFNANLTGRFPYELEASHTELGALEVLPK